jgi:hypothetical protein
MQQYGNYGNVAKVDSLCAGKGALKQAAFRLQVTK